MVHLFNLEDQAVSILFEQWAREEIKRLRSEADVLQRALDKFLESQQVAASAPVHKPNGIEHVVRRKAPIPKRGSKRGFVLKRISDAGAHGASTEELFAAVGAANLGMKRSSLRALLWHEKAEGTLEVRDGRYVTKREGPSE